jgi:hypothetical protein
VYVVRGDHDPRHARGNREVARQQIAPRDRQLDREARGISGRDAASQRGEGIDLDAPFRSPPGGSDRERKRRLLHRRGPVSACAVTCGARPPIAQGGFPRRYPD